MLRDKRQRASFALYAAGLLNDGERKSMEPLAARASGDPELFSGPPSVDPFSIQLCVAR